MKNLYVTPKGVRYLANEPLSEDDIAVKVESSGDRRSITPESIFSLTLYQLVILIISIGGIVTTYFTFVNRLEAVETDTSTIKQRETDFQDYMKNMSSKIDRVDALVTEYLRRNDQRNQSH